MANTPLVGFRVPEDLQKELRAAAAARGVTLSTFFREAVLAALVDHHPGGPPEVERRLTA